MGEPAAFGSRSVPGTCQYILKDKERIPGDPQKCGAPEYRRSFCQAHYEDCYDTVKTAKLRSRGPLERMADLPEIPATLNKKGQW